MSVIIEPYAKQHADAVRAFNARLVAAGGDIIFPDYQETCALAKTGAGEIYDEYFVAVENGAVHGGYVLKHQPYWVDGRVIQAAQFRLPISEGHLDKRLAYVGVQMYLDAVRRQPRLLALGLGGYQETVSQMLVKAGWKTWPVPFYYRVLHAKSFLRNIVYLRTTPLRRAVLDVLATSGLGTLAVGAYQTLKTPGAGRDAARVEYSVEASFGSWADDVWQAAKSDFAMIAVRDSANLNVLYPTSESRWIRLKVSDEGRVIGWAVVLNVPMQRHNYFGDMRVGSLIDCLATPGMQPAVAAAAVRYLREGGAEIVVANMAHDRWREALESAGLLQGPSNYIFATSPKVSALIDPFEVNKHRVHMTRGDGVGAQNLLEARKEIAAPRETASVS